MTALAYLELALSVLGGLSIVITLGLAILTLKEAAQRARAAHRRGVERVRDGERPLRAVPYPEPEHQGGAA